MRIFRRGPFLAAVALTTLLSLYVALVAQRAVWFLRLNILARLTSL